ncbi:hypothetical protein QQX10_06495 [Demequina sp. SYSU T00039]|uniref:DUF4190 domain-containing protein n=1 Tax=Demequina lignilytica TaxID=3051663 RepID=A0AAW7M8G0_9MICO|nr:MULTISPECIES: hypothetical protein [unclassified Demequina]MDN4477906.1 hypothetical protein [Demequina sp. SYSU T00039-1]MDN4487815.1 hypothetical protein [Demequina sp. SYSU T00039]
MTQTAESPAEHAAEAPRESGGNGVGIAAFVTGALALAPLALILGLIGLARYRSGKASRRSWPLAGTILGAVGIVAGTAIGVAYALSEAPQVAQDAHAKVDVVKVGNALVDWSAAHAGATTPVSLTDTGYEVDGLAIPSELDQLEARGVTVLDPEPYAWCLTLTYDGGTSSAVAFSATEGLIDSCPAG